MSGLSTFINWTLLSLAVNFYCCTAAKSETYPQLNEVIKDAIKECAGVNDVKILIEKNKNEASDEFTFFECLLNVRNQFSNELREAFAEAAETDLGKNKYDQLIQQCKNHEIMFGLTDGNNMASAAYRCYRRTFKNLKEEE